MQAYKVVDTGVIEVRYTITEYPMDDGTFSYDWTAGDGDESDELFYSMEDARQDVERKYGA